MRDKLVEFDWAVIRVLYGEEALPRILERAAARDRLLLFATYRSVRMEAVPDIVQVSVQVQVASAGPTRVRLVRQPAVTEAHPVASGVEAVGHPPSTATLPIVVAAHEQFAPRQLRENRSPALCLSDEDIAEMDHDIFRLNDLLPIADDQLGEVRRPIAVGRNIQMIEVGVGN